MVFLYISHIVPMINQDSEAFRLQVRQNKYFLMTTLFCTLCSAFTSAVAHGTETE